MNGWMYGWMDVPLDVLVDAGIYIWMDDLLEFGWIDGWMERKVYG